jgi:hypothetical protein
MNFENRQNIDAEKEARTANSTFAKGGILCIADTFVVAENSVLRTNICAGMPAHRQSAKRWTQLPRMKQKMIRYLLIVFLLTISQLQYGYGQKSSKHKTNNIDSFTILTFGMGIPQKFKDAESIIAKKWNIQFKSVAGCLPSAKLIDSVNKINKISNSNIENKYGKSWRNKFDEEVMSELKIIRSVAKIVDNLYLVRKKRKQIESRNGFLSYTTNPTHNPNEYFVSVDGLDVENGKDQWFSFYRLTVNTETKIAILRSKIKRKI